MCDGIQPNIQYGVMAYCQKYNIQIYNFEHTNKGKKGQRVPGNPGSHELYAALFKSPLAIQKVILSLTVPQYFRFACGWVKNQALLLWLSIRRQPQEFQRPSSGQGTRQACSSEGWKNLKSLVVHTDRHFTVPPQNTGRFSRPPTGLSLKIQKWLP